MGSLPCSSELADLVEHQPRALRDVDHGQAAQHGVVVAALAADTLGLGKQPDVLVVADQRHPDVGPPRDLSDAHLHVVHDCP